MAHSSETVSVRRELDPVARPLLERDAELAALRSAVESARGGDGRLVVVEGPAGIGKTRLLSEARSLAAEFEVLSARAGELESDFAFGIVRQLFEGALATAPADVRAELLSGAAGLAAPLFAVVPGEPEPGGTETSFAMLHGLYWLAANLALRQPTLLVVDDLHWADEPSLRWLGYLARRLEGLALLVLAATRPSEQAHTPALVTELLADPLATLIRPRALGQQSAVTLAQVLFGLEPDEPFAAALREASGGNPLYLTALLDTVAREEIEPTTAQAPRLPTLGGDAVARGVGLRLSRLTPEAIAVIRAAAILGDGAELRDVATLAELEGSAAGQAASMLVRSELLRQEEPLEFIHPVVRTAVLGDVDVGERMRLHHRAALTLLDAGSPPEQAAAHLQQTIPAGDPFVVATLLHAAQRSLSRGAPEAAIVYLRRALDEPPEPDQRREVLAELGIAESAIGLADDAAVHLRQSLDGLSDIAQRPDLVLAYLYALTLIADRSPEAIGLIQRLGNRFEDEPVLNERIAARIMIASHYVGELYPIARQQWDTVSAGDGGNPIQAGVLLVTGALEEARRGVSRERTVQLCRRAVASGIAGSDERLFLINGVYGLTLAGELDEAESTLQLGIEHARRAGDRYTAAAFYMWRGVLLEERGDLLAAEADLSEPEIPSFYEMPTPFAYWSGFLAVLLLERGAGEEAEKLLRKASLEGVEPGHQILFLIARGLVCLETGTPELALVDFRAVREIAGSLGIENPALCPWRSLSALALHRLGRVSEGLELAREELDLSRRWGAPRTIGISLRALGLVEGGEVGERLLREAVEVLGRSPARLEHARALIDLGAALRRANSRSEARKHLREGVDLAHQCGASALVTRGNEELAATGAHPRTILLSGLESLTASERRVAQMAAEEVSNKEIAQALFVTVKTVEVHLSRVYRKLDIESRRQLAGALSAPAAKTAATT
jgi:DNA-binding CsgD family transcriptional regulator